MYVSRKFIKHGSENSNNNDNRDLAYHDGNSGKKLLNKLLEFLSIFINI